MSIRPFIIVLLLLMHSSCALTKTQVYPVDDLIIFTAKQSDGVFDMSYVGSGDLVPMEHHVAAHRDRIVVKWDKAKTKYDKPAYTVSINNPKDVPVFVSDGTVTKQVYPVNELAPEKP